MDDREMRTGRTLSIVRQMAKGRLLTLPDSHVVGMGEDMTVGFVVTIRGEEGVSSISEMTLRELDELLTKADVGFPIPSARG